MRVGVAAAGDRGVLVGAVHGVGAGTSDVLHEKTNLLGGTLVLSKEGKVVHEFRETSSFYQGEAADLTLRT